MNDIGSDINYQQDNHKTMFQLTYYKLNPLIGNTRLDTRNFIFIWTGELFSQQSMPTGLNSHYHYYSIYTLTEEEFINDINKILDPRTNKSIDKLSSKMNTKINIRKFIRFKGDIHAEDNIYFYLAVLMNYKSALDLLLSINDFDECFNRDQLYVIALFHNNIDTIRFFIETRKPLANKLELALIFAVAHGMTEVVDYLISYGVNVCCYENTPLSIAALYAHIPIIKLLLQAGAVVNKFYDSTMVSNTLTVLNNDTFACSIFSNDAETIKLFIELGCNVEENIFALTFAVLHNSKNAIRILIENGMDYHTNNDAAFGLACSYKRFDLIKYFLELGMDDIHFFEKYFSLYCKYSNVTIVEILLDHLRKLNLSDHILNYDHGLPLKKFFTDTKDLLSSSAIKINTYHCNHVIHFYTLHDMGYLLKILIRNGANIDKFLDRLCLVVSFGDLELFNLFIDAGAYIYQNDPNVLLNAVNSKNIQIVKYLIDSGTDIHYNSENALCAAIFNSDNEMIKLLTDAGADMDIEFIEQILWKECQRYRPSSPNFVLEIKGNRIKPEINRPPTPDFSLDGCDMNFKISSWNQSTIEPDTNVRCFSNNDDTVGL